MSQMKKSRVRVWAQRMGLNVKYAGKRNTVPHSEEIPFSKGGWFVGNDAFPRVIEKPEDLLRPIDDRR